MTSELIARLVLDLAGIDWQPQDSWRIKGAYLGRTKNCCGTEIGKRSARSRYRRVGRNRHATGLHQSNRCDTGDDGKERRQNDRSRQEALIGSYEEAVGGTQKEIGS
jgi:hypothetical protein